MGLFEYLFATKHDKRRVFPNDIGSNIPDFE